MMDDMLRILGLKKQVAPAHVRSFQAAKGRLNGELGRREDAFASMISGMAGRPGAGRKTKNSTKPKRRD